MSKDAFIVDGIRTPVGSFRGGLSSFRADDLAALPIRFLAEKYEFLRTETDDVILGCANQAGEDNRNVARMALLLAGLHYAVPGETVNRLCASGMSAAVHAQRAIHAGDGDIFISGGIEHMTRGPYVIAKTSQAFGSDAKLYDSSFGWRFINPKMKEMYGVDAMGETAENLAQKYGISRADQDMFAYNSQIKASLAQESGRLEKELIAVNVAIGKSGHLTVDKDEFIKPTTTLEILSKLRPAFRSDGTVTAGNASGLNDGAAALLLASNDGVTRHGLKPLTRIVSSGVAGVEPRIMGIGPVLASQKALAKAGLTIDQMDIIEINEAFAVQVLACLQELGIAADDGRVNPNGGAIALGHPLGMSGARILLTASIELNLLKKKYALVTMCIGVGQGYAVVLENCNL
ncbi:MAG: acetyl-CoA C-acyltransferase [Chitinophagales bacterium]|nr:acetyl-CoA C-acyltransferase [Chitinophagales bacterium]